MSFDAFYGLPEPSSPPFVSKRKVTDDAHINHPSPKRVHIEHGQEGPQPGDPTSSAKGRTYYWMVQWYGNMLVRGPSLPC